MAVNLGGYGIVQTYPGVFDKGGLFDRKRMSVTIDGKRVPLTPEAVRKATRERERERHGRGED